MGLWANIDGYFEDSHGKYEKDALVAPEPVRQRARSEYGNNRERPQAENGRETHNPEPIGERLCRRHGFKWRRLRMVSVPSTGDVCIGVFAAFVVAIGVYGIIIMFEFTDGASSIEVKSAKLAMVGDGQTSDIVHGNIVFVVDKYARLLLAGDVQEVELLMSDGNTSRIAGKDGSRIIQL